MQGACARSVEAFYCLGCFLQKKHCLFSQEHRTLLEVYNKHDYRHRYRGESESLSQGRNVKDLRLSFKVSKTSFVLTRWVLEYTARNGGGDKHDSGPIICLLSCVIVIRIGYSEICCLHTAIPVFFFCMRLSQHTSIINLVCTVCTEQPICRRCHCTVPAAAIASIHSSCSFQ